MVFVKTFRHTSISAAVTIDLRKRLYIFDGMYIIEYLDLVKLFKNITDFESDILVL